MPKILIVYYSRTRNTKKMAEVLAEGARTVQGIEVEVTRYVSPKKLDEFDAIVIGAPTYNHTMPDYIKNFLEEIAVEGVNLKGKIGAAFGSYGWSGEAPRFVLEVMENKFEMEVLKPPLLVKYAPGEIDLEKCHNLGRQIAEKIVS